MKIAALLTTFNRREKTITCLQSLAAQQLPADVSIDVFLTDDSSSDGTAEEVKKLFPSTILLQGTGSLFWAGGMRNSWRHALASASDYFLLLNDDTVLATNAIDELLKQESKQLEKHQKPAICIGSTANPYTGEISYGGRKLLSSKTWKTGNILHSKTEALQCDVANANIMLVPQNVVLDIGILSDAYTHSLADYDYTLRAKKAGYKVLVAPGFLGTCEDDHGRNWKSTNVKLKDRISYLMSPKGLAYKEYLAFIRRHFPLSYPSAFVKLWMKTFFPFIWDTYKR